MDYPSASASYFITVQASLEQVKLFLQGGGAGMSVESISAITKLQGYANQP
jgi:hypothetical protein